VCSERVSYRSSLAKEKTEVSRGEKKKGRSKILQKLVKVSSNEKKKKESIRNSTENRGENEKKKGLKKKRNLHWRFQRGKSGW